VNFLLPLVAALACIATLVGLLRMFGDRLPVDNPNERSLHKQPVPRIGGVAIMVAALPTMSAAGVPLPVVALAAVLAGVSFADDRRGLPIAWRFSAHFAVAVLFVVAVGTELAPWTWLLLVPAIVWLINLYNFMDGSDGLAGGMAVVGFGVYGIAAYASGDPALAAGSASIAAAAAGFLLFNFHPARVFMGDTGSVALGFLAAALGIEGWLRGHWPFWFPLAVFAPFVVDATVTLVRRMFRGERFWQAHRSHYYQRLVQLGWGHRRTALAEYGCMAASASAALWARTEPPAVQVLVLAVGALCYAIGARAVDVAWRRHLEALGA